MSAHRYLWVLTTLLVLHLNLGAHAAPLAFDEALRLAQERSRQLPALASAAAASREMAVAAGQRPDPVIKAGISTCPSTALTASASRAIS